MRRARTAQVAARPGARPRRQRLPGAALLALAGLLLAAGTAIAPAAGALFAGRTLTVLVGLPPGGGADSYARLVQRHLAAHLAGAPSIVVQNVPGAGSLKSLLALDALPADGTAIGTFSSGLLTEAITSPGRVRVDFRNYAFVGNVSPDVRVCYIRHGAGVRNWHDLLARGQVNFAASAAGTAGNVDAAMLRDLFGVKLKEVEGYAGSAAKRLAVESGEVDGDCGGWTEMPPDWLRDHKVDVVVRLSPVLLPGMDAQLPYAGDLLKGARARALYDFLMAPEKLGRLFLVSGRTPKAAVAALRQGFAAMVADPLFRQDAARMALTVAPMSGEEVTRAVAALYATPPDLVARARAIAAQ